MASNEPLYEDEDKITDHEDQAGMGKHSCTDIPCLILFILYAAGLVWILNYSLENGDIRKLTHGFNYAGELCGVDKIVEERPYLFWCGGMETTTLPDGTKIPTGLNLEDPICVKECPGGEEKLPCPQPSETSVSKDPEVHYPYAVTTTTIVQEIVPVKSYPTKVFASKYCMPKDTGLMKSLLVDGPMSGTTSQIMSTAGSLRRGWNILIGVAVMSFILGYAYLAFMKVFAKILVWTVLTLLCISFLGCGAYLIATAGNTDDPDHPRQNLFNNYAGEYATETSYGAGGVLCLFGLILVILLTCAQKSIATAVACVEEACNTMFAMPSLLLQPALEVAVKLVVLGVLLYGFGWLLTVGKMTKSSATIGGQKINGVHRSFEYDEDEIKYILYYILGMFWIDEIFTAMGQFVISYSVVLYYFCPKDESGRKLAPSFPLFRGYGIGFFFHLGTVAFGAAIIAIIRIISLILSYLAKQAEKEGNAVLAAVAKCLVCCIQCFKKFMEFLNKNAYMDVAIRSTSFCTAARNAIKMIMQEAALMALLNGACFVFQMAGLGLISGLSGWVTYKTVTTHSYYTANDSMGYVDNPMALAVAGFLIGFSIGYPFMLTFDQCADTLLYCFVVDKTRPSDHDYCPDKLRQLIDDNTEK